MPQQNIFILASDNSPTLLPLLQSNPSLASSQDAHGYSLLHAAASYNHTSLLRSLVNEFHADINIEDNDGETALFVVETVEAAQVLVEELKIDVGVRNAEGFTAEENIEGEGDYPTVAAYLRETRLRGVKDAASSNTHNERVESLTPNGEAVTGLQHPPPLPPNVTVNVGTAEEQLMEGDIDPEFRRRIEELAAREDFQGEDGQKQLRELITDAVREVGAGERDVRQRLG